MIASLTMAVLGGALMVISPWSLTAQGPEQLTREREVFRSWLLSSPVSPLKAIARMPVVNDLRLGPPEADIPLSDVPEHRFRSEGRSVLLESTEGRKRLPPNRAIPLGNYTLLMENVATHSVVTVYGDAAGKEPPGYYPYDSSLSFVGALNPPDKPRKVRVLSPDGLEREAVDAGSVLVPLAGGSLLKVLRIQGARDDESELEIFFQDQTNDAGTYPAGRFVTLVPLSNGRYLLDFNRARNPFCAYSSAYACPAPWPGNAIKAEIRAGERYEGGGLDPADTPRRQ
jgi:hypothetical protein